MAKSEQCRNCRFSDAIAANLVCRRYPPTALAHRELAEYPYVSDDEWCGEYQKKPGARTSVGTAPRPSFSHGRSKSVVETVKRPAVGLIR